MYFTKREKIIAAVGYVVFMLLFFFIGMPKMRFLPFVVGFLALTAFYAFGVWFVKKFIIE